jgi:hypothetical protein
MLDATASHVPAVERRTETRVPTSGAARLAVLGDEPLDLAVSLIDVSRWGVQIESAQPIEPFTLVELHLKTLVLNGAVGRCRPHNDRFRLGLRTTSLVDTPQA